MSLLHLSTRERRALVIAPLVAPFAYGAGLVLVALIRTLRAGESGTFFVAPLPLLAVLLGIGAPIAYAAMAVVGLPAYLTLRRAGRAHRLALLAVGGSAGAGVAALLAPLLRGELFSIPFPMWAGVALGVLTAEAFVRLLRRGGERPPGAGAVS